MKVKEFDKMAGDILKTAKEVETIILLHKLNKNIDKWKEVSIARKAIFNKPPIGKNVQECKEMFDGWYIHSNYNSLNEGILAEGQSILTREQKENLINYGKL